MKKYSISQLAKEFELSRSTLLHYDSIGLLKPATRTESNYRIYTENEYKRLSQICSLRSTGISLEKVQEIINSEDSLASEILKDRLTEINNEIGKLRFQQNIIISILGSDELIKSTKVLTKETWSDLLRSAGLDDEGMHKWHIEFESAAPEAHRDFLESLGLSQTEIEKIRKWSR